MSTALLHKTLKLYGLGPSMVIEPQKGYRNYSYPAVLKNGQAVNLILYKSEPSILKKIELANSVSDYLYNQGLPTRRTVDGRILKLQNGSVVRYGVLYNYLPGQTIPWEAYTRSHLKALGHTMAQMHSLLNIMPATKAPSVADEYTKIVERMQDYFADQNTQSAIRQKLNLSIRPGFLNYFLQILNLSKNMPNQQMLHMDFVRGNILFDQNSNGQFYVSGILDFEKAACGHKLFDIARTMAFLLVDCKFKSAAEIHKHFLISGYIRSGKGTYSDIIIKSGSRRISMTRALIDLFLLYDFYKFLRHNPYESLSQNEHYVRTRDILLNRRIVVVPNTK